MEMICMIRSWWDDRRKEKKDSWRETVTWREKGRDSCGLHPKVGSWWETMMKKKEIMIGGRKIECIGEKKEKLLTSLAMIALVDREKDRWVRHCFENV